MLVILLNLIAGASQMKDFYMTKFLPPVRFLFAKIRHSMRQMTERAVKYVKNPFNLFGFYDFLPLVYIKTDKQNVMKEHPEYADSSFMTFKYTKIQS